MALLQLEMCEALRISPQANNSDQAEPPAMVDTPDLPEQDLGIEMPERQVNNFFGDIKVVIDGN
eukprot:CAMPEP_0170465722 /NCGR_PEP_ID=MMETSP0123-20130129/9960_1 /TAXON_ID=182087 /ORGANISM="Favella ehrenbergii, Strain Fehren 1" /LENGTH=63 /DNA_ID=CAMNT_0010731691 /DNA_START=52 /DNA_END=243 /DNA_ORIENTATION=-